MTFQIDHKKIKKIHDFFSFDHLTLFLDVINRMDGLLWIPWNTRTQKNITPDYSSCFPEIRDIKIKI